MWNEQFQNTAAQIWMGIWMKSEEFCMKVRGMVKYDSNQTYCYQYEWMNKVLPNGTELPYVVKNHFLSLHYTAFLFKSGLF